MYDQHDVEALERQFNAAMEEADTGSALDAVRRIYDEFDRANAETLEALLHPDFEMRMETIFLDGKSYKGVRGFLRWRDEMEELFEEDRFQPEGMRFAGKDRWIVLGRLQIKGSDDGDELDVPLAHVFEQRDRKVASFTAYSDIADALAVVGLGSP
jgi:ketosteroid isomerase-like protein